MSIISNMPFIGEDTRKRKFILPKKVISTCGNIENTDSLLKAKAVQIGLGETDFAILKNNDSGKNSYIVLDFGYELHGGVRILTYGVKSKSPANIRLTFGESLSEALGEIGEKGATNDHAAHQFTVPIMSLSDQEWGSTGFRFLRIELITPNASVELKSVIGVLVIRDFEYKGSFQCSDNMLNRIYDTAAYTCHLCCQNMLWDGIKRDRLVWIGDLMPESMTVHDVFGGEKIVEDSLDFVREQTPLPKWMNGIPAYSMWWILILKDWYMATGNIEFLKKQMPYLEGLFRQLIACVKEDGKCDFGEAWVFLDWPTNDNPNKINGVSALLKLALLDCSYIFNVFNMKEQSKEALDAVNKIKGDGSCGEAKQIAAFMALSNMLCKNEAVSIITKDSTKGLSTFLLYFILKAVAISGECDRAIEMLRDYCGEMINKGATSFFEDYNIAWSENSSTLDTMPKGSMRDIHADFGDYCYKGHRHSLCHGWASGAVPFLREFVLGIEIMEPGCKALKIKPNLGDLTFAKGVFPTPFGNVTISHIKNKKGEIETTIDAPKGIKIIK